MSAIVAALAIAIPMTTPILIATMGGIISERAGVLNLGIEGIMAVGALIGIVVTATTGTPWLGFAAGIIGGLVFSSILTLLSVTLKSDQVITGVMLTLLGVALSTYFGREWVGVNVNSFSATPVPIIGEQLRAIPGIGEVLFYNTPVDYIAVLLVPIVWYFLFRTNIGLEITAVGNDPETADTMSINVTQTRHLCVLLSGALAGAGGAALSLSFTGYWTTGLINNRGWVAVALIIVSRWNPLWALLSSYFFGMIYAAQYRAQAVDYNEFMPLSDQLGSLYDVIFHSVVMSSYPFLLTIAVLVIFTYKSRRKLGAPQALAKPYLRESE